MSQLVSSIYNPVAPRPLGVGDVVAKPGSRKYLLVASGEREVVAVALGGDFNRWREPKTVKNVDRLDADDVLAILGAQWDKFERVGRMGEDIGLVQGRAK